MQAKSKEPPHPVDLHVGARLRMRRQQVRMSQTALAEAIGVTFQQVQKYERGTNRISASKLMEIAQVLNMPVSGFFEGYSQTQTRQSSVREAEINTFLDTPEGIELAQIFPKIDPLFRRRLMSLMRAMVTKT